MNTFEVTCVTKPNRYSQHEHIIHIGGPAGGGWIRTREEVISLIDTKTASFYVKDYITGKIAYIGVVRQLGKLPYLRTHADGDWNDNLLSLNECAYRVA